MDDEEPLAIYVYKTMTDPSRARISFFKVISGKMKNDATLVNYTRREPEAAHAPLHHAGTQAGRGAGTACRRSGRGCQAAQHAHRRHAGRQGPGHLHRAGADARAGDDLRHRAEDAARDEDKLAPALHKLMEEDPMVRFFRDPQTNEFLVAGAGQPHIEAIVSKLQQRYHTDVIAEGAQGALPRDRPRQG